MTAEVASRKVRVSPELMAEWKAWRTLEGDLVTCDWGDPDAEGFYEPQFTISWNDGLVPAAKAAALRDVSERLLQLDHDYALAAPTLAVPKPYEWTESELAAAESMLAGVLLVLGGGTE